MQSDNIDRKTVEGFGREWAAYDQTALGEREQRAAFDAYFSIFPWDQLPSNSEGIDLGCGSGRWAELAAERVGALHCIDPSADALEVARRRLGARKNVDFHLAGSHDIPLADSSQDFGYSLGVLHHIPDTATAMRDCVKKLKRGAPFLVYLYYSFDNKPGWYRFVWNASEVGRRTISGLPFGIKKVLTTLIAGTVYWPLARLAKAGEASGKDVSNYPLSAYRRSSFYTMRTDALDRFGTRLEHRFSRAQIEAMMRSAGLTDVRFRESVPFWVAVGRRES